MIGEQTQRKVPGDHPGGGQGQREANLSDVLLLQVLCLCPEVLGLREQTAPRSFSAGSVCLFSTQLLSAYCMPEAVCGLG